MIKDSTGNWMVGFTHELGQCGVLKTEEWAMCLGLKLAWEEGFKKILVETDSKLLVDKLMAPSDDPNSSLVFHQIREYLKKAWEVEFKYIPRKQNSMADALAKEGLSSSFILFLCPINLRTVLLNDCMGLDPLALNPLI